MSEPRTPYSSEQLARDLTVSLAPLQALRDERNALRDQCDDYRDVLETIITMLNADVYYADILLVAQEALRQEDRP